MLSLQFNLERRDRSRREYVLLEEEGVSETLLSLLSPIIKHNQESLSLINRVEVCHMILCVTPFDSLDSSSLCTRVCHGIGYQLLSVPV